MLQQTAKDCEIAEDQIDHTPLHSLSAEARFLSFFMSETKYSHAASYCDSPAKLGTLYIHRHWTAFISYICMTQLQPVTFCFILLCSEFHTMSFNQNI